MQAGALITVQNLIFAMGNLNGLQMDANAEVLVTYVLTLSQGVLIGPGQLRLARGGLMNIYQPYLQSNARLQNDVSAVVCLPCLNWKLMKNMSV